MDDVTIEDELDGNEQILSKREVKGSTFWFKLFQLIDYQWIYLLYLIIFISIFVYWNKIRKRNSTSQIGSVHNEEKSVNRYEDMERIRKAQQKAYEEQILRYAEEKKAKMEGLKAKQDESPSQSKYRSDNYNPLTGQSNRGSGDSCSWRPSSRRKGAGG